MGLKSEPDDEDLKEDEGAGEGGACIESSLTRRLWWDSGVCKVEDKREEEAEEETVDIMVKERDGRYGVLEESGRGEGDRRIRRCRSGGGSVCQRTLYELGIEDDDADG